MRRDGTDDHPQRDDDRTHRRADPEFRAVVERYDDEPDQCTIFPVDEDDRESTWITAEAPGFVDLNTQR